MPGRGRTLGIPVLVALVVGPLVAQQSEQRVLAPLPVELVLRAKRFSEGAVPHFSPDRRLLAYVVRDPSRSEETSGWTSATWLRSGIPWFAIGAEIWLTEPRTGVTRRLPDASGNAWAPVWSPDGRSVAFLSDRASPKAAGAHDTGDRSVARPWLWDITKGSARLIADVDVHGWAVSLQWSADGRRVLGALLPEGMSPAVYAGRRIAPSRGMSGETRLVSGATVTVYRSGPADTGSAAVAGAWSLDVPVDLAWIDVATGSVQRLVRHANVAAVRLSPDGRHLAYTVRTRFERPGSQQILYDLLVVADGQPPHVVARDIRLGPDGGQFNWSPDGSRIAFRTAGPLAVAELYVVALDGAPPKLATGAGHRPWGYSSSGPLWEATGRFFYTTDSASIWRAAADGSGLAEVARLRDCTLMLLEQLPGQLWQLPNSVATIALARNCQGGATGWYRVDLSTGEGRLIAGEEQYVGNSPSNASVAVATDGRQLVYLREDVSHPPDLYWASPATLDAPRRLTQINPGFDHYLMGERRIIAWRTVDGDTVRGVLVLPAGYQAGTRYPLLTKVYGGELPTQTGANRFGTQLSAVDNLQLFASRGYAVLLPDIPLERDGQVMLDLLKIVLPGVDKVVELGIADPGRLGLFGHSFGGYNTIALLTETTRFKAAMMSAGQADLLAAYGQLGPDGTTFGIAVLEHGQFLLNATPWEHPDRYLESSPILHLDRVTTPLLIVHGGNDSAVAPWLADEVFVGLRRLGREVVYAKYAGEGHHQGQWSYPNQLDYWTRVLAWFGDHLQKTTSSGLE